jgi:hypothetical protein
LEDLLKYFNGNWAGTVSHYCAVRKMVNGNSVVSRMCAPGQCKQNLCRVKAVAFWRHRAKSPTDKDWLALRVAQCWTELGISLHNLLTRAMTAVCGADTRGAAENRAVAAHDAEAHPDGRLRIQGARIKDSARFFEDPRMHRMNRLMLIAAGPSQELLYFFLKGPTIHDILDPDESGLAKCINDITGLIEGWELAEASPWSSLSDFDADWQHTSANIDLARHYMTSMQAGIVKAFWDECYSLSPFDAYPLRSSKFTEGEKVNVSNDIVNNRCCQSPYCGQRIIDLAHGRAVELRRPFVGAVLEMAQDVPDHGV